MEDMRIFQRAIEMRKTILLASVVGFSLTALACASEPPNPADLPVPSPKPLMPQAAIVPPPSLAVTGTNPPGARNNTASPLIKAGHDA